MNNQNVNIRQFLKEHGFKSFGGLKYNLPLKVDEVDHLLNVDIYTTEICLFKADDLKQITNFDKGELTIERIKNIYKKITCLELEIKPIVYCNDSDLKQLGFIQNGYFYSLLVPTKIEDSAQSTEIIVSLVFPIIKLKLQDSKYNEIERVLEKQNISLKRIMELYRGLTGMELSQQVKE